MIVWQLKLKLLGKNWICYLERETNFLLKDPDKTIIFKVADLAIYWL